MIFHLKHILTTSILVIFAAKVIHAHTHAYAHSEIEEATYLTPRGLIRKLFSKSGLGRRLRRSRSSGTTRNYDSKCGVGEPSSKAKEKADQIVQKYVEEKKSLFTGAGAAATAYTIPVYWHVIHSGDKGKLTSEEIESSINILNEAFRGQMETYPNDCNGSPVQSGMNTEISFNLVDIDFTDYDYHFQDIEDFAPCFAPTLHKGDGCKALNVYSGGMSGGNQGYATFPFEECDYGYESLDGAFMNYKNIVGGSDTDFSEGDVLVHEVGHWLGLFHTFENGCLGSGDSVQDTPASLSATDGCPSSRDSCPNQSGNDPIHNFMDYSNDCCIYEFTEDQATRMKAHIDKYRS